MSIDTHVPGGSAQAFSFAVRDVLLGLGITVLLGHAEINHMDHCCTFRTRTADQKIVGFDVTINKIFLVDGLYAV